MSTCCCGLYSPPPHLMPPLPGRALIQTAGVRCAPAPAPASAAHAGGGGGACGDRSCHQQLGERRGHQDWRGSDGVRSQGHARQAAADAPSSSATAPSTWAAVAPHLPHLPLRHTSPCTVRMQLLGRWLPPVPLRMDTCAHIHACAHAHAHAFARARTHAHRERRRSSPVSCTICTSLPSLATRRPAAYLAGGVLPRLLPESAVLLDAGRNIKYDWSRQQARAEAEAAAAGGGWSSGALQGGAGGGRRAKRKSDGCVCHVCLLDTFWPRACVLACVRAYVRARGRRRARSQHCWPSAGRLAAAHLEQRPAPRGGGGGGLSKCVWRGVVVRACMGRGGVGKGRA